MHKRSGLWNPSNSTEIRLNHLWWVITLLGWAEGMLDLRGGWKGEGRKPRVRFREGGQSSNDNTRAKGLWWARLSRGWPQDLGFILVNLLAGDEAVSLTFWGFCLGWNRTLGSCWVSRTGSSSQTGHIGKGQTDYQANWGSGQSTCSSREPKRTVGTIADTVKAAEGPRGLGAFPQGLFGCRVLQGTGSVQQSLSLASTPLPATLPSSP